MKPSAYIVDLDGTMCIMQDRSPYDWAKVGEDLPNAPIVKIIKILFNAGYKIIFLSGRDSCCRPSTEIWLDKHFGTSYELYMRKMKDNRKDAIVKRELFDEHIRDNYTIEAVFDDRDQVVSLWRKDLGLTCLQVNYGDK